MTPAKQLAALRKFVLAERRWYRKARRKPMNATNEASWHDQCDRADYVLEGVLVQFKCLARPTTRRKG